MARRLSPALSDPGSDAVARALVFLCITLAALAGWFFVPVSEFQPLLLGLSAGLCTFAVGVLIALGLTRVQAYRALHRAKAELENFTEPAFLTDSAGRLLARNGAAEGFRGANLNDPVARLFRTELADPASVLRQMMTLAEHAGGARRELASGRVLRLLRQNDSRLIWTVEAEEIVVDRTALPVVHLDSDGVVVSYNRAASQVFGTPDDDLAHQFTDVALRTGAMQSYRTRDGELRATAVVTTEAEGRQRVTLVPQVEAAQGATALVAQPGLLEALPVPMLKIAVDGGLIEANTEARSIFGLKDEKLPPLFELVEGMGRPISDWLSDAAEGQGLLRPEIVRAVKPGQELFLQIALGRMMENNEMVLVGILNDATELKTLEAQFVQSQKMQAIGQLAGGVAHDFNNLLTAISGHCDLLLLRHDAGDPEYSDLIQISQNANRAASLVGQLLAFSRKQNLKPQSLDIRDTMSDLAHLLNRLIGERIQLNVSHDLGPQMIRADRRQLEQVIVNLVVNARDAMPDGGAINIRTRPEFLDAETTRDRARLTPGSYVVIEVEDTGSGISPEGLTKIFEPFYTTKKTGEGTGLGLSTAYGIVKQTGGYIFVESEVGKGTTFSLYFKANQKKEPEIAVEEPKEVRVTPGDGVVLLVEDEAPVRAFAARALRMRGYTVVEAECAEDALDILTDEAMQFDVFVTDVIMPGMDGPTWVRKALKQRAETPVIFMSGYAEEGRAEKQARIPNSVFLPKPFSLQQLTSLVQEQLS